MTEGENALNADATLPEGRAAHLSSASRQFNFWLGEWDLTWQDGGSGTNSVRAILDGTVIFESFDAGPTDTFKGMSFSVYNLALGKWQQTWVDNQGNYLDFVGTYLDGKMMMERVVTLAKKTIMQRMVFYNITDTSLDWIWERSEDQGAAWEPLWQIHYKRRSGL